MKITIYELLGMIKDGKAPKKIKINNDNLTLSKTNIIEYNFERSGQLCWDYYIENYRLDEKIVEIPEKEKKIPAKLGKIEDNDGYIDQNDVIKIGKKIDEIIDYLKSKGE